MTNLRAELVLCGETRSFILGISVSGVERDVGRELSGSKFCASGPDGLAVGRDLHDGPL